MKFIPSGRPTSVGSLPHRDPAEAVRLVLHAFPEIPAWPQLPNRSFLENMYVQYSEGLPCLVVDHTNEKIYFDTTRNVMAEMESFYGGVIEGDLDRFSLTEEYAPGFHRLIDALSGSARDNLACVKGQIVGPISFGLSVTDQNKRAILYHEELMDAALKSISMKAAWQVRELKKVCPRVMIWLDEPYLASFGSGYVSLSAQQVLSYIGEVVQGIHGAWALAGIHCCGNTDWSLLMQTELDIINFDAYDYFRGMTLYPEALKRFLDNGRTLALGIVPTSDKIRSETVESLSSKLDERLRTLSEKTGLGVETIHSHCLITPSCGTGTLSEELAKEVLEMGGKIRMQMTNDKYQMPKHNEVL